MQLLADLLDLPSQIDKGDYVLKLVDGVSASNATRTLMNYVVTPQLEACFDHALGFIKSAVDANSSKACYLHGSFGSGKSHFMAVLHLLLQNNPEARSIKELADVVAKHNEWTHGRKFLLVPFHMIGSRSMEQGILGRYADYVRRLHPEAPVPGVYLAESLFEDAQSLRKDMGDAAFFDKLNQNRAGGKDGWGKISEGWTGATFEAAVNEPPGRKDGTRGQLVGDLIAAYFRSYHNVAAGQDEAYLDLDHGLAVLSQHAQALGYDALVLFLDELILWLASHAADLSFIHRETQKLVKLVEGQHADRPIPLISFVARQRDLRKLIGDTVPGAQKLNFDDSVDWSDGRFGVIKLEDRNLPMIAHKRVLKTRSAAARQELDDAFQSTAKIRKEVMDTLLANEFDRDMFKLIYPFSPALMETLIAASSMLQRERTAIKVMMQLLVEQQQTLKVGDIVPVGDLYDAVAHGDEAFSQDMKVHFDNARKLYHEKLLPMLEAQHEGRRDELLAKPFDDQTRINFVNDDRLIKTLLLAALVPGVNSLRALTANRLAALNHGTIRSPIPGKEAGLVLQKCKQWAAEVGEIKVESEGGNATIAIQLSGVDTEAILAAATHEDNPGNQMRMVRQILFEELEIDNADQMYLSHEFLWRNTHRECDVIYGNVRSLPDTSLTANADMWKVIIDYPFDEPGHTTRDDIGKLQLYGQNNSNGTRTIIWLPAFFSESAMRDLSRLVIIEHVLTGERFNGYASFLSPQDRPTARTLLANQRSSLRERVKQHIEAAYGIRGSQSKSIDNAHELTDTFRSLYPSLDLQPPAASSLKGALEDLLGQGLGFEFPQHPSFGAEIKSLHLRKVHDEVIKATSEKGGRVLVERNCRSLVKQIAEPLNLGEQGETHFVLSQRWRDHFLRKANESGTTMTVVALRKWIDEPRPMGLPKECANLIIMVFAAQTNRSFFRHGAPFDATLANLPEEVELREQRLPPEQSWVTAIERASRIFGYVSSPLLNAANLAKLADEIQTRAKAQIDACRKLVDNLGVQLSDFGETKEKAPRFQTAQAVLELLEAISDTTPAALVESLANLTPQTSEAAMGTSYASAPQVVTSLTSTQWKLFDSMRSIQDDRATAAEGILRRVVEALSGDQHVVDLGPVLRMEQNKAIDLLTPVATGHTAPPGGSTTGGNGPGTVTVTPPPKKEGKKVIDSGSRDNLTPEEAKNEIDRISKQMKDKQTARVNVSWVVEE
ncbi:MAG: phage resistance protein [Phycisphaerae bacterium]|nr:phage resistance protein [Phycisphaerae bacterium]